MCNQVTSRDGVSYETPVCAKLKLPLGPYSMTVSQGEKVAGTDSYLSVQCDPETIGNDLCAHMYLVRFRGPIAFTIFPNQQLYQVDDEKGTTVIKFNVPQPGRYEIWV